MACLMGWAGVDSTAAVTLVGAFYLAGAAGMTLGGIFELIIGFVFLDFALSFRGVGY